MPELPWMVINASVLPVWLCMMLAPSSALSQRLAALPAIPAAWAVLYSTLLLASSVTGGDGSMASMAELRVAFDRDLVLLLAWVHYLCFDMIVGMWELRDARRLDLPRPLVTVCLAMTLFFGPAGFLLYCIARWRLRGATGWTAQG